MYYIDGTPVGGVVDAKVDRGSVSVTADGSKTYAQLLQTLYGLVDTSKLSKNSILQVHNSICTCYEINSNDYFFSRFYTDSTANMFITTFIFRSSSAKRLTWKLTSGGNTPYDESSETVSSGRVLTLYY